MNIFSSKDLIRQEELQVGEAYIFCDEYYMKIENVNKNGTVCNAVNLRTGEVTYRSGETRVCKCNAKVVIE